MAVANGFGKVATSGSVFMYDTGDTVNSYKGKPTTNFFTNGHFSGGVGISQEGGSNPTNDIIYFPSNPGASDYVLRQTMGIAETEYQINLTSELQAGTTYVMSGWYGESPDYVGESRMFHSRAFSNSGAHNALGVGIGTVLASIQIGGVLWRYCYATITTPADYSNNFNWYIGYSGGSYTGARYYTNIMMEQGTTPSQFVNGTRSVTQGLLPLVGNSTINLSNVSFDSNAQIVFDGTDDYIGVTLLSSLSVYCLEMVWYNNNAIPNNDTVIGGPSTYQTPIEFNGNGQGVHLGAWTGGFTNEAIHIWGPSGATANQVYAAVGYHHVLFNWNGTTYDIWVDGVNTPTQYLSGNNPATLITANSIKLGDDVNGYTFNGQIPVTRIYNRALSTAEVKQNYNKYKSRFNLP